MVENADFTTFEVPTDDVDVIEPLQWQSGHDSEPQVLIILNQEIGIPRDIFEKLWKSSKLRIAVDGGAQRLKNFDDKYIPDYIIGDFDSVSQDVLNHFRAQGVHVIHQETQYSTDLMKLLSLCNLVLNFGYTCQKVDLYDGIYKLEQDHISKSRDTARSKIFIVGGIGGRLDQTVQAISILYRHHISHPQMQLVYINKDMEDVIVLIPKGETYVKVKTDTEKDKRIIGLLPFGPLVMLTTSGLKWDVRNWSSEIGSKVSSSNHMVSSQGVLIKSSGAFIMNIEVMDSDFR